jgi:hypothetical protein
MQGVSLENDSLAKCQPPWRIFLPGSVSRGFEKWGCDVFDYINQQTDG